MQLINITVLLSQGSIGCQRQLIAGQLHAALALSRHRAGQLQLIGTACHSQIHGKIRIGTAVDISFHAKLPLALRHSYQQLALVHRQRTVKRRFLGIRRFQQILHIPFIFVIHCEINLGAHHINPAQRTLRLLHCQPGAQRKHSARQLSHLLALSILYDNVRQLGRQAAFPFQAADRNTAVDVFRCQLLHLRYRLLNILRHHRMN